MTRKVTELPSLTDEQGELLKALTSDAPPDYCPVCHAIVREPRKDDAGLWTWHCLEGCNP